MTKAAPIKDTYSLSPVQEGMLFHSLYSPGEGIYFEQRWCTLRGQVDVEKLQLAWNQVVAQHDILRTQFNWRDEQQPLQQVVAEVEFQLHYEDWQALSVEGAEQAFQQHLLADRKQGFDLARASLMRCSLIQLKPAVFRLLWSYHHILMDGWCNGILIQQLLASYEGLCADKPIELPPVPPYATFIQWLQRQDLKAAENYWRQALAGVDAATPLPYMAAAPQPHQPGEAVQLAFQLSAELCTQLQTLSRNNKVTLNTLLQGAWGLCLGRWNDQADVLFGAALANRPAYLPGADAMIGLFLNTVPVRVLWQEEMNVGAWLQQLQADQVEREAFGFAGLNDIRQWHQAGTQPQQTTLFDSILVFENYPLSSAMALAGSNQLQISDLGGYERVHYPLAIMVVPENGANDQLALAIEFRFDAQLFSTHAMESLRRQLIEVLQAMVSADCLSEVNSVTRAEFNRQQAWGRGDSLALESPPLPQRIQQQAQTHPNALALMVPAESWSSSAEPETISYQQMQQRVDLLAAGLQQLGIGKGQRVGVCLSRSPDLPQCLLAILSVGALYVPLDPAFPAARLNYIVEDAQLSAIIVDQATMDLASQQQWSTVIESRDLLRTSQQPVKLCTLDFHDPAYLIYTSGSTGNPKGVLINHGNLINFLAAMTNTLTLTPQHRMLAITTISFDISVLELFLPLINGACLVLGDKDLVRDAPRLVASLDRLNISHLQASPSSWRLLKEMQWSGKDDLYALSGGEALESSLARWLVGKTKALWNVYGPTETTVWSAAIKVEPTQLQGPTALVGGPIANTQLWVLDRRLQPLPQGAVGELYISGAGLAEGYWQRPELTAKVFVPNPHAADLCLPGTGGNRLYRTGDRVQWQADGTLVFLGRVDHQIKLRGFRIETGEIEKHLLNQPGVKQAVVIKQDSLSGVADSQAEAQLVAYLVVATELEVGLLQQRLRTALAKNLPDYMVPTGWMVLDEMPLTPNGKLDRKQLPALQPPADNDTASPGNLPTTPLQEIVALLWGQVLGLTGPVYLSHQFFHAGGHSLLATRLVGQLQQALQLDIPLRLLFEYPVLADFVAQVEQLEHGPAILNDNISMVDRSQAILASWAQRRLWLQQQLDPNNRAYQIPVALRFSGSLDRVALQASITTLFHRHEVLRQGFSELQGEPQGFILTPDQAIAALDFQQQPLAASESINEAMIATAIAQIQAEPFDLSQPPLVKLSLISGPNDHLLILNLHHILVDDWSLGILVTELNQLYSQGSVQQSIADNETASIQFADFAAWQRQQDYSEQLAYWQQALANFPEPMALPYLPATNNPAQAARVALKLSDQTLLQLQQLGRDQGMTLFMLLLTGFYLTLARYCRSSDFVVATPIANRLHPQTQALVGLLINTLPLRAKLSPGQTLSELLQQVRQQCLDGFSHQDLPFDRMLENINTGYRSEALPIQAMFALQGADLEQLNLQQTQWRSLQLPATDPKFDLSVQLRLTQTEQGDQAVHGWLEYDTRCFSPSLMAQFAGHYQTILGLMGAPPSPYYQHWSLLSQEQQRFIENASQGPSSQQHLTVPQWFQQQRLQQPNSLAIIDGTARLSYQQLDEASNQLAHLLIELGVGAEMPVAFWAQRSWQAVQMMLAILKAGGCYVPLDPRDPKERIKRILKNTGTGLVLCKTEAELAAFRPDELGVDVVPLPLDVLAPSLAEMPVSAPPMTANSQQLAYVMHTSGSTGEPKAVAVVHGGIGRLVKQANYVQLNQQTLMLQAAPLAFDAATFEIWGALLNGGTLVIQSGSENDLDQTASLIEQQQITTAWLTAGLFQAMVEEHLPALSKLRQLLAGGDRLSMEHIKRLRAAAPEVTIINGYGPTEATTFTCCHPISQQDIDRSRIPIGRPINDTQLLVMDRNGQLVPPGVIGELYVSGQGLARGYLNQPGRTAAAFLPNPLFRANQSGYTGQVLYNTGDLVRLTDEGVWLFEGREDQQLKIRGFRIEIQEVEQAVLALAKFERVHVGLVQQSDRKQLAVWYSAENGKPQAESLVALRAQLGESLPDYMQPRIWINVDHWPLNANGKLDVKRLPQVSDCNNSASSLDNTPASALVPTLIDLWQPMFPGQRLQSNSHFFELGGDSIVAMQIASRGQRAGLPITAAMLFEHPEIDRLAFELNATLGRNSANWQAPADQVTGTQVLTPIQQWFFQQQLAVPNHFNQALMLHSPQPLADDLLQQVFTAVVQRHDGFRLQFKVANPHVVTAVYAEPMTSAAIEVVDLRGQPDQSAELDSSVRHWQASLDIQHGPLHRFVHYRCDDGDRLLLIIHHLIVDGVSWRMLLEELFLAWQQRIQGHPIALGAKPYSLQQYGLQLLQHKPSSETKAFWQQFLLAGGAEEQFPTELVPAEQSLSCYGQTHTLRQRLSAQATQWLLQDSDSSVAAMLVSAIGASLCEWSQRRSLLVQVESHGRQIPSNTGMDFSQTMGWFTAIYPVRVSAFATDSVQALQQQAQSLQQWQQSLPDQGASFGQLRFDASSGFADTDQNLVVNYLGQLDTGLGVGALFRRENTPEPLIHPSNSTPYRLEINAWIEANELSMEWRYDPRLYTEHTIAGMMAVVVKLLNSLETDQKPVVDDQLMAALAQVSFSNES